MPQVKQIDYQLIHQMADAGFHFAWCQPDSSSPRQKEWGKTATRDKQQILDWLEEGKTLAVVAMRDAGFAIDVDDLDACLAKGFKMEWLSGYWHSTTPSGGYHYFGLATQEMSRLLNIINIYTVKGDKKSGKILELKLAGGSVAAPTSRRFGDPKKVDGYYVPSAPWTGTRTGIDPEFEAWLIANAETSTEHRSSKPKVIRFHKTWDEEAFAETEQVTINLHGEVRDDNGVSYFVVVDECNFCDRSARNGGLRAGLCKFIFTGDNFVYRCNPGDTTYSREEYEAKMDEIFEGYEPWDDFIYELDDPATLVRIWGGMAPEWAKDDPVKKPEPTPDTLPEPEEQQKLRYPELRFPYEAIPEGQFKKMVDLACEGGLSPGLVAPAILIIASGIPATDTMDGCRISEYGCLLSLVGAGKDSAIDRARAVFGLEGDNDLIAKYAPSGERSIAMLVGDKADPENKGKRIPGDRRKVIVTYELEDTLNKSKGETSSVLQAMQWYYDHNDKVYADSKTRMTQTVNCRISWLTALPVGDQEIDEDDFRRAFGESSTHGTSSRLIFGFAEERFDRRRSRNWRVPEEFHTFNRESVDGEGDLNFKCRQVDTLVSRLRKRVVEGWAPGMERQFLNWNPIKNMSGRDTYHIQKIAILTALLNEHSLIEQSDWDFAKAFMEWQTQIRLAFTPSRAKRTTQGEFNDTIVREIEKRLARIKKEGGITEKRAKYEKAVEEDGKTRYYFLWRKLANDGKWHLKGLDIERSIDALVRGGILVYWVTKELDEKGEFKSFETHDQWVRSAKST